MGIMSFIRSQFIEIVEWTDDSNYTLVWRFPDQDHEIKNGAKLVCRPGQACILVNEGKAADIFGPGTHTLSTQNIPVLSRLRGWKYGFSSPFKAEVYFVSTRRFTDLKWGTMNPVMMRDSEFGPVRLRAFGTYVVRVKDPVAFIREIVGTNAHFDTDGVTDQLRNMIVARFSDILGESDIPILDLAANYDELGEFITAKITPEFSAYGLEVSSLLVENISLPPAVEEALDKRTSMGVVGDLRKFTPFQTAEAMAKAADNPGGMAAGGMGMGMGFAMAGQMAQSMGAPDHPAHNQPPPIPATAQFFVAVDGEQTGPFTIDMLQQQARKGAITRQTLVWKPGMEQWKPAGELPDLGAAFASVPPPLPGQE